MRWRRFLYNNMSLKPRRRMLRNDSTEAEKILWKRLQRSQLGVKFRRQHSVGNYILDFYCPEKKLAIELDGLVHKLSKSLDEYRTRTLTEHEIKVIRFWNKEVEEEIEKVIRMINTTLFDSPS
jgi:very-short-patch-repair endonuclease